MIDTTQPKIRFEFYPRRTLMRGKLWYFRIVARNNEIIAVSEGYKEIREAVRTASLIRINASDSGQIFFEKDERP